MFTSLDQELTAETHGYKVKIKFQGQSFFIFIFLIQNNGFKGTQIFYFSKRLIRFSKLVIVYFAITSHTLHCFQLLKM